MNPGERAQKSRKGWKTAIAVAAGIAVMLAAVFLVGRFGWKLFGFDACQGAEIHSVEVRPDAVRIAGVSPGLVPKGFCGTCAEERDGTLFVGFHFSALFGFFETGAFNVEIPVRGEIRRVVLKTSANETVVWRADESSAPLS